jgi:thiol-disulfide isomerase/thioredoxin
MTKLKVTSRPGEYLEIGRIGKKANSMEMALQNAAVGHGFRPLKFENKLGEIIDIDRCRGIPTVIYVWSSNCGPCKKSMPYYLAAYERHISHGREFEIIALNINEKPSDLATFLKETPLPFSVPWIGPYAKVLHEWRIDAFPTTFILDRTMTVRARGQMSEEFLMAAMEKVAA